jgi:hypothetical protein
MGIRDSEQPGTLGVRDLDGGTAADASCSGVVSGGGGGGGKYDCMIAWKGGSGGNDFSTHYYSISTRCHYWLASFRHGHGTCPESWIVPYAIDNWGPCGDERKERH